jgi:hypothetical protein
MIVTRWLEAFMLTLALELPIASFGFRDAEPRVPRKLALIAYANLATHPLVWFVFARLEFAYATRIAISELWAWLLEALFYRLVFCVTTRRALAVSFIANAFSAVVGYFIMRM